MSFTSLRKNSRSRAMNYNSNLEELPYNQTVQQDSSMNWPKQSLASINIMSIRDKGSFDSQDVKQSIIEPQQMWETESYRDS